MSKRAGTIGAAVALTVSAVALRAHGVQVVSTYPQWNGGSVFAQMGEQPSVPATEATWGQTLTPPAAAPILKQFSVTLSDSPVFEPDPLKFRGYLMQWTGTRAAGSILYQSPTLTADGMAHGEYRRFDMTGIDKTLDPLKAYVFFISCSQLFDGVDSVAYVAGMPQDNYPGGHLVTLNNKNNASLWTTTDWQQTGQWDMTFEAVFAEVPEPATAVAPLALAAIALKRRARRGET